MSETLNKPVIQSEFQIDKRGEMIILFEELKFTQLDAAEIFGTTLQDKKSILNFRIKTFFVREQRTLAVILRI